MKPLHLVAALSAALLCSCATTPQVAPHFTQPDLTPIVKAHAVIKAKQAETKTHIQKAKTIVKTIHLSLPEDQLKIDELAKELDSADTSNDQLNAALATAESKTDEAQAKVKEQTEKANKLSGDYNTLHAHDAQAQAIVDQVNRCWGIGAFAYGAVRLAKHLFILTAVLGVVAIAVLVLSFFFPFIIPMLKSAGAIIAALFTKIGSVFRKK